MGNVEIIRIEEDRLDFQTVVDLERKMLSIMKAEPKAILIDMEKVTYSDSRAIGLFVGFKIQCDSKRIQLGLFNLTHDVQYIFKVTAVDTAINIYDNEEEAVRKIKEKLDE